MEDTMDRMQRTLILLLSLNYYAYADMSKPQVWIGIENETSHKGNISVGDVPIADRQLAKMASAVQPAIVSENQRWSLELEQLITPQVSASIKGHFGNNDHSLHPLLFATESNSIELIAKYHDNKTAHGFGIGLGKDVLIAGGLLAADGAISLSGLSPSISFNTEIYLTNQVKASIGASASAKMFLNSSAKLQGRLFSGPAAALLFEENLETPVSYATYASIAYNLNSQ